MLLMMNYLVGVMVVLVVVFVLGLMGVYFEKVLKDFIILVFVWMRNI